MKQKVGLIFFFNVRYQNHFSFPLDDTVNILAEQASVNVCRPTTVYYDQISYLSSDRYMLGEALLWI